QGGFALVDRFPTAAARQHQEQTDHEELLHAALRFNRRGSAHSGSSAPFCGPRAAPSSILPLYHPSISGPNIPIPVEQASRLLGLSRRDACSTEAPVSNILVWPRRSCFGTLSDEQHEVLSTPGWSVAQSRRMLPCLPRKTPELLPSSFVPCIAAV